MTWRRFLAGLGVVVVAAYAVTVALCLRPDGLGLSLSVLFAYLGGRATLAIWRGGNADPS